MTKPTPHRQVPEALRLAEQYDHGDPAAHGNAWKAAVCTELRRQHARIAELEAQIAAVGAGGVQALSAAPADVEDAIAWLVTWKGGEHTYVHAHASELPAVTQARVMGGTVTPCVAALAASPTPTAEQQAQPGAVGRTGCTAGTDEECTRRGCATSCPAQQAAPKAAPAIKPLQC